MLSAWNHSEISFLSCLAMKFPRIVSAATGEIGVDEGETDEEIGDGTDEVADELSEDETSEEKFLPLFFSRKKVKTKTAPASAKIVAIIKRVFLSYRMLKREASLSETKSLPVRNENRSAKPPAGQFPCQSRQSAACRILMPRHNPRPSFELLLRPQ